MALGLEAALWSLVAAVGVGAAAPVASVLVQRGVNRAYVIAAGFGLSVAGLLELTQTHADSTVVPVLIGAGRCPVAWSWPCPRSPS